MDERYKKFVNKYPDVLNEDNIIDLNKLINILVLSTKFEDDKKTLQTLGLENFVQDMRIAFMDIKEERKEKLKNLNK